MDEFDIEDITFGCHCEECLWVDEEISVYKPWIYGKEQ
jgi:hypothetical protein